MKFIDLHIHSNASDGSLTPSEVVQTAARKGLGAIALTDHDTTDGIAEALAAGDSLDIEVIPGIEISCIWNDTEIHLLGLYIDYECEALQSFLHEAHRKRRERNQKILGAFQADGFSVTMEDLQSGNAKTTITRAHFARALLAKGYVQSIREAFETYLNPECPYYRKREPISPQDALPAICSADGFPVLAHPCQYRFGWEQTEEFILFLKHFGLKGLECFHSTNSPEESERLLSLARRHRLSPTGGSDFHGIAKPDIEIGSGRGSLKIPALYLDDIKLSMFLS